VKGAACGGEAFDTFMASSKVVLTSACNGKLEPIQDHVLGDVVALLLPLQSSVQLACSSWESGC